MPKNQASSAASDMFFASLTSMDRVDFLNNLLCNFFLSLQKPLSSPENYRHYREGEQAKKDSLLHFAFSSFIVEHEVFVYMKDKHHLSTFQRNTKSVFS